MRSISFVLLCFCSALWAEPVEWSQAHELYQRTEYQKSLATLLPIPKKDAAVLRLIGQNYFMLADYKKATEYLEAAVALAPNDPEVVLWLGRTYGRRAETSGPFTAPRFASKARQMLERAVSLQPENREAVGDLFDFYMEAPGFLGGGQNKAEALAAQVSRRDPAEGHYYYAQLDTKKNAYESAEQHLRTALQLAPRQVGRLMDLAMFLSARGRTRESDALFDEAERLAPDNPKVKFERARTYIRERRNLSQARELLEQYLRSPLTPNDPPRSEAEALLKQI